MKQEVFKKEGIAVKLVSPCIQIIIEHNLRYFAANINIFSYFLFLSLF